MKRCRLYGELKCRDDQDGQYCGRCDKIQGDVMADRDRENLIGNIVDHLGGAQKNIQLRQTALLLKADSDYGRRVAEGLGLALGEIEKLASMSQDDRVKATY